MSSSTLRASLSVLCLVPAVMAQQAGEPHPIPFEVQRVPIHTAPDPAEAAEYGWWAVGPGYKVSFHDGFVFHPHVGSTQPSMPLGWITEKITAGGESLLGSHNAPFAGAEHWHSDWRYEYRRVSRARRSESREAQIEFKASEPPP